MEVFPDYKYRCTPSPNTIMNTCDLEDSWPSPSYHLRWPLFLIWMIFISSQCLFYFCFETRPCHVAQADLHLENFLPLHPEYGDGRHEPCTLSLASNSFLNCMFGKYLLLIWGLPFTQLILSWKVCILTFNVIKPPMLLFVVSVLYIIFNFFPVPKSQRHSQILTSRLWELMPLCVEIFSLPWYLELIFVLILLWERKAYD